MIRSNDLNCVGANLCWMHPSPSESLQMSQSLQHIACISSGIGSQCKCNNKLCYALAVCQHNQLSCFFLVNIKAYACTHAVALAACVTDAKDEVCYVLVSFILAWIITTTCKCYIFFLTMPVSSFPALQLVWSLPEARARTCAVASAVQERVEHQGTTCVACTSTWKHHMT